MNIGQKQCVGSLRFYLYDRALHPELFDIFDDRRVSCGAYDAQIWVTGCSHVVSFFRPSGTLTEVIANAELELPRRGLMLELPFRGEKDHQRKTLGGISYMMNFQVERMSPAVYSKTHHDLARAGAKRGLFVPFPLWMAGTLTPFTYIDFDARPNELHVYAFHAFPDELTMVKTQSIFEPG